jgi:methyl-accepting chemotaxis protein
MTAQQNLSAEHEAQFFAGINVRSDTKMNIAIALFFIFGIGLSFVYGTYLIGIGVGGLCLVVYFATKTLLPKSSLSRYVLAVVYAIFGAQFIYQMHGMFEMHFIFFIGSALLITYQDWRLQIPLVLFVVLHHGTFAYLQYSGMKEIYFTQLDYMDLQSFVFHAGIAAIIFFINGLWAYGLGKRTRSEARSRVELEGQVVNISNNIQFANEISAGNLNVNYDVTSSDELGKALVTMRGNLVVASERERAEKYLTQGIASIGEILRKNADSVETLSFELIREIAKYTGSNQGALFLVNKDEDGTEYLWLTAAYAYDRKKFLEKRIEIGDTLVGQCYLEKDIIHMTHVPKDYVKITSGLGLATPTNLILVPLISNEQVTGVVELASFNRYTENEIDLLKKIAEAIATSFLSVKTTEHIKRLLADSQQRQEEMRAQEEEMRQNMEELSATQEEMLRNSKEMESRVEAINNSGIAAIEFNLDGTILTANPAFLTLMGYSLGEIQGRHHRMFVEPDHALTQDYKQFWLDLAEGITKPGEYTRVKKDGARVHIVGSYSVIRNKIGQPERVLKLATDVTRSHEQVLMVKRQEKDINIRSIEMECKMRAIDDGGIAMIEFNLDGTIISANNNFLSLMGYSLNEIRGKHHRIFVNSETAMSEQYKNFWDALKQGIPQPGDYERVGKTGNRILIRGSYSIMRDEDHKPVRIIKLATDISAQKQNPFQRKAS